jgi:hypothetical protein
MFKLYAQTCFIIMWRAAQKLEHLSHSGRPLLGNGSVSTVLYRCLGDNEASSRYNEYITDLITQVQNQN